MVIKNETFIVFSIALFFFLFSLFLPIYDKKNGFHNLIFDNYKLTWYDGRSPANFHVILNLVENKSASFPKGYRIGDIPVENHYDFVNIGGMYKPMFRVLPLYFFTIPFYLIPIQNQLLSFKIILILNITLSSISLAVFYFLQRLLGLKRNYCIISTIIGGIATSLLIYSHYLFLVETFCTLTFMLLLYIILKNWKKPSLKLDILISSIFSIVLLSSKEVIIPFLFFLYLFHRFKVLKYPTIFVVFSVATILFLYVYYTMFLVKPFIEIKRENLNINDNLYNIFPHYINALDYDVYGYHNTTFEWKLDRYFSYVYGFKEGKGNAIFLFFHGLFGALFGPKGFVFNSPFLIFSFLGIFAYKRRKKKNFILYIIIFFILIFGLFHFMWYGGGTPRYVRHFDIPILLLTFFSFYYIQETSREKNKTKKYSIYVIFTLLVILSILNVSSLAIRADWTYEHEADLVSYDLVLWPWYPLSGVKELENKTVISLTSAEISHWKLSGEDGCKAKFTGMGLMTDPCFCAFDSWAERRVKLKKDVRSIEVTACTGLAGNDGTKGFVYIDNELIGEVFIKSHSCASENLFVNITSGEHIIKLKSGIYGNCTGDIIFWKSIMFKE